jgi:hypothetical protein
MEYEEWKGKSGNWIKEAKVRTQVVFTCFASESEKGGRNAEEKEKEEEKAKDCSELPSIQRGKGSEPY